MSLAAGKTILAKLIVPSHYMLAFVRSTYPEILKARDHLVESLTGDLAKQ